jgi:hypothetical protein
LPEKLGFPAFVAQRIEHLTTDQKVGGSSPSKRTPLIFLSGLSAGQTNSVRLTKSAFPVQFVSIPTRTGKNPRSSSSELNSDQVAPRL